MTNKLNKNTLIIISKTLVSLPIIVNNDFYNFGIFNNNFLIRISKTIVSLIRALSAVQ